MVVAEVEILEQAKYLYISHEVQNTIQCLFLAYFIKQKPKVFSHLP